MEISEIIKALRACNTPGGCKSCPLESNARMVDGEFCGRYLKRQAVDALERLNRRAAPENKALTVEQLRKMLNDWVWLIDAEHPKFNGWYTIRPFHGGGDRIEFWGVDNAYYERAIEDGSVKVYARKPEESEKR